MPPPVRCRHPPLLCGKPADANVCAAKPGAPISDNGRVKAWLPLLAIMFCACAHDLTRSSLREPRAGAGGWVPMGLASGYAERVSLLRHDAPTQDLERQALARARGKSLEAEFTEGTVERLSSCLFSCRLPLARRVRVTVSGTLAKPSGYRDPDTPPHPEAIISPRFPTPSAETLYTRLFETYQRSPEEAGTFYQSMDPASRGVLRDFILSTKGQKTNAGHEFRLASALALKERYFLLWFLIEHTPYRPQ